jgi:hypothetical protein
MPRQCCVHAASALTAQMSLLWRLCVPAIHSGRVPPRAADGRAYARSIKSGSTLDAGRGRPAERVALSTPPRATKSPPKADVSRSVAILGRDHSGVRRRLLAKAVVVAPVIPAPSSCANSRAWASALSQIGKGAADAPADRSHERPLNSCTGTRPVRSPNLDGTSQKDTLRVLARCLCLKVVRAGGGRRGPRSQPRSRRPLVGM